MNSEEKTEMREDSALLRLKFREPSPETKRAVCHAALYGEIPDPEKKIRKITGHRYVRILSSGNATILLTVSRLDGPILVPD